MSPPAAPPDHDPQSEILVLGDGRDGEPSGPPWFTRARQLVLLAAVVAVVVAVNFPGRWTMSPEHAAPPSNGYRSFGTFEPVTLSGNGSAEVLLPAAWAAGARSGVMTIRYAGTGRFRPGVGART